MGSKWFGLAFMLYLLARVIDRLVADGYSFVGLLFVVFVSGLVVLTLINFVIEVIREEWS